MRHTDRPLVVSTSAKLSGVVGQLTGRAGEVAICMDFDGPIAPIVQDPAAARPLPDMVELLGRWPTATPPWP
jgi:trehalose 6-phosphate phosphatase